MKLTSFVSNRDLLEAHKRWLEVWPCPLVCNWSRFLGEERFPDSPFYQGEACWFINQQGAERIRLLLTPHYKTLLKAMAVQYVQTIFE